MTPRTRPKKERLRLRKRRIIEVDLLRVFTCRYVTPRTETTFEALWLLGELFTAMVTICCVRSLHSWVPR
jgi:hypothetical protein